MRAWRWLLVISWVVLAQSGSRAQRADTTKADAASMAAKLETIAIRGVGPPNRSAARRTSFTENEVNAYFKVDGHDFMPVGVVNPEIAIEEGGRVRARATVDMDAVRKAQAHSWMSPLAYLSGSMDVHVVAVVHGEKGTGTLALESVTIGGVPVPISVLQLIVSSYSKTPEMPQGFALDRPFPLPSNIQALDIQRGVCTVVQ